MAYNCSRKFATVCNYSDHGFHSTFTDPFTLDILHTVVYQLINSALKVQVNIKLNNMDNPQPYLQITTLIYKSRGDSFCMAWYPYESLTIF